jgi:beta-lactamase superfamily II metal-dependent hydrolase
LIPGLPEVLRMKKKRNRKETKQKNEVNTKKVSDMKATDVLLRTLSGKIISNDSNDISIVLKIEDDLIFVLGNLGS